MCGIAGILRFDDQPIDRARLERMQAALAERGPDDRGLFIDGRLGFAHTRLAILDPATGRQPMTSRDDAGRTVTVVFNGEIYNHRDMRRELEAGGAVFTTDHSDTEVLLHGYRAWGDDLPNRLRGMFAFAIWDGVDLFLARDRAGKKPLFVAARDREFIFASTVAAVRAAIDGEAHINHDAMHHYLTFGYTLGPTTLESVQEVPPFDAVRVSARPAVQPPPSPPRRERPSDIAELTRLLTDAVHARLEADVPLGCFLSGGIDSSLIAAIAQRKLKETGGRLKTFSVSMPDANYDEGPWARQVADHIGSEHFELRAEPRVEEDLQFLIRTMGEPLADSSLLPTYWLSKLTRQHVKVALSGDGGDELFAGYERYRAMRLMKRHAWWLRMLPGSLFHGDAKSATARLGRLIEASRFPDDRLRYLSIVRLFTDEQLRSLGYGEWDAFDDPNVVSKFREPDEFARDFDVEHYLPGDLLRKVDRASMAVGLEVRCPMLDRELVDAALATPMATLVPGRQTKQLLREIARPLLPANIVERRKMGFAIPIGDWFRGSLKPVLTRWLLDKSHLEDVATRSGVESLITQHMAGADHSQRLFALLSLSMWVAWLEESNTGTVEPLVT